jgi:hypothetical protein
VLVSDLRTLPLSAAHYTAGRDWSKRIHVAGATIAPRIWTVMYQNIDPPQNPLKVLRSLRATARQHHWHVCTEAGRTRLGAPG